jgi:hypothetical protein
MKIVESRIIYWSKEDDRFILVVKNGTEIIGLNFCQGDEIEIFLENFNCIDEDLTRFYQAIDPILSSVIEIDRINEVMWAYLRYKM